MWRIIVRDGLRGSDFQPPERENPSAHEIVELAEEAIGRVDEPEAVPAIETLRSFIDRSRAQSRTDAGGDGTSHVPMLEPIRRWADEAVEAAGGAESDAASIRQFAGGIGLVERGELESFAWHGDSVAVVPVSEGSTAVELTYRPEREERRQRDRIKESYAEGTAVPRWWPWAEIEVSLDAVGFFVDYDNGPSLAEITARDANSPRRYSFQLELASTAAGFLIVKPLYRLAKGLRVRARDPLREARVRRAERRLRFSSPDLRNDEFLPSKRPVVLVHGLGASAADLALMLEPLGLNPLRFEHDTFISIDDNAQELATLVAERLEVAEEIILLCHSRGGLVARAAADLVPPALASRLSIHTFGTPHLGTPLAEFGSLVPLIHLLELVRNPGDVLRAADRYLLPRTWRTPEGIEEMSPTDAFISRMIHAPHNATAGLNSWGAEFKDNSTAQWGHRQAARVCRGVLLDPHDLVVSQSSSLGAGTPQGPLDAPSTHFDYLGLPQVHDYLRALV